MPIWQNCIALYVGALNVGQNLWCLLVLSVLYSGTICKQAYTGVGIQIGSQLASEQPGNAGCRIDSMKNML